jgi:hypothetical protein
VGESLALDGGELGLVEAAALLHDVGRLEQYTRYRTFHDARSEDHAAMGVRVLEEGGVLAGLDAADRRLVLDAVAHHNRLSIPDGQPERAARLTRIVRDADKLDIWWTAISFFRGEPGDWSDSITLDLPDRPEITDEVFEAVMAGRLPRMDRLRTVCDFKVTQMGWVFDLCFERSFALVRERRFLEQLRDTMPPSGRRDRAFEAAQARVDRGHRPGGP